MNKTPEDEEFERIERESGWRKRQIALDQKAGNARELGLDYKPRGEERMKVEDIHNIYTHMTGRAEGMVMSGGEADFPVMFAEAILDYYKKPWVGLTDAEIKDILDCGRSGLVDIKKTEAKLKEKNT